jgi:hypothetical protein
MQPPKAVAGARKASAYARDDQRTEQRQEQARDGRGDSRGQREEQRCTDAQLQHGERVDRRPQFGTQPKSLDQEIGAPRGQEFSDRCRGIHHRQAEPKNHHECRHVSPQKVDPSSSLLALPVFPMRALGDVADVNRCRHTVAVLCRLV